MIDIVFEVVDRGDLIFVEVEDSKGNSISTGQWQEEEIVDGITYKRLRISSYDDNDKRCYYTGHC